MPSNGWPDLPLLGRTQGAVRFELSLPEGVPLEERDDPFLPLSDSGRISRVLLARITAGENATVTTLAVKLQRSTVRAGKVPLTNPQIDDLWQRERENLLRAGGGEVASMLNLGEGSFRNPPLTFCKKVRAYFQPFCPACRGPLTDCRDDALLREHGLPEYSKSAVRYLHCRACLVAGPGKRTFYTSSPGTDEAPRGGAVVRRRGELYRDLAAVIDDKKLPESERARLSAAYACFSCPHRAACYPAGAPAGKPVPAESLLVPVSYNEFYLLPLEALELHYDEFSDLLGGAAWPAVRDRAVAGSPGRERHLKPLDETFAAPLQWLYGNDHSGRYSLEILRVKLILFSQVARGLRRYHAACREPHLDLAPSKVMVRLGAAGSSLPARWNFQARLIGLANPPRSIPSATSPEVRALLAPPPDADATYVSPIIRDKRTGAEESMRVSIRSISAGDAGVTIQGAIASDRVRLDAYRPGDVIRILPASPVAALENVSVWGVLGEREDRAWGFTAALPKGTPLDPARKIADFEASVSFYRNFHVPCDLYGLGMLLLRSLLVNDERDIFAVDDAVQRILKKLALRYEGKQSAERQVRDELAVLLEHERSVFGPAELFHSQEDRQEQPLAIPGPLWRDVLAFGFRLLTTLAGFSFSADHADYPADRPEALMDRVLTDLETLENRVAIELFRRVERDREISEVVGEVIAELSAAGGPAGA